MAASVKLDILLYLLVVLLLGLQLERGGLVVEWVSWVWVQKELRQEGVEDVD